MRTARTKKSYGIDFGPKVPVKMKIVEILEAKTTCLSVRDVVEITGMSKSKIYQQIAQGELPSIRIGGSIKIDPNQLIAWWKQHQIGIGSLVAGPIDEASHKSPGSAAEQLQRAV